LLMDLMLTFSSVLSLSYDSASFTLRAWASFMLFIAALRRSVACSISCSSCAFWAVALEMSLSRAGIFVLAASIPDVRSAVPVRQ